MINLYKGSLFSSSSRSLPNTSTRTLEVIHKRWSYSLYPIQEKLHHNRMYTVLAEGLQTLAMPPRNDSPSEVTHASNVVVDPKCESRQNEGKLDLAPLAVSCSDQCLHELPYPYSSAEFSTYCQIHAVTVSFPSPLTCHVEDASRDSHLSRIKTTDTECGNSSSSNDLSSSLLRNVHISERLMEDFLELAKDNTEKDLETCGVLGAFLESRTFYVTTLIIPKQESTSNSCQAKNEEEVFAIQHGRSLFPVGWIHTHPSQSCFMSSIDLHTQFSYQVMVPEAFAIVMAPTDASRSYGIFRLSDPGGMDVLRECRETGFHPHKDPDGGIPIFQQCTNVYKNSNLRFEIFDLR
ncbi:AMSH-like ubiquitin thioesterase 2 isoform X2 [Punica granatum]|uniref:AMSH-like ubiquitin thioesterase 2 isoform X2 n=2 Tax=Punica granatum TaxID=22663 RepID=A0A6P8D492_PUNGR|nr:AMSH-like ubiquitin thioesterase 2 isoform X2 [Punica granatum]